MKRRQNIDLGGAFPPVPERFHARLEGTLRSLEKKEEEKVRKFAFSTALVAAIVSVLLVGTALAVGSSLGLIDFLKEETVAPLDNAIESITTDLGSVQSDSLCLTVREAVYDGACVRSLVEVTPVEPEKYVLTCLWLGDEADSMQAEDEALAAETGRQLLPIDYLWSGSLADSIPMDFTSDRYILRREGDSLLFYVESLLTPREEGVISDSINMALFLDEGEESSLRVPFTLDRQTLASAVYTPDTAAFENVTIEEITLTQTPFAEYLNVTYSAVRVGDAPTVDPQATYYGTRIGRFAHLDPACSGMQGAEEMTAEQVLEKGVDYLCPICAGGSLDALGSVDNGYNWYFRREGAAEDAFWQSYIAEDEEGSVKSYTNVSVYPASEVFPDTLTLDALHFGQPAGITISCAKAE